MGGAVSTGLRVARGMLAVVQGCDEGWGVGRLRAVLLGAGGRALGRGSSASLKLLADMATDADVGWAPGATASWHGPRLWIEMSRPWRQAMVLS